MGHCWSWFTQKFRFSSDPGDNDCLIEMSPVKVIRLEGEADLLSSRCSHHRRPHKQHKINHYKRRKSLREILNPTFLRLNKKDERTSCLFQSHHPSGSSLTFASHDVNDCLFGKRKVSDVENGNVREVGANSKHGSLSTLNMEWDNQDCFKDEDFKEKIFQEQNRLNRKNNELFSPRLAIMNSPLSRVRAVDNNSHCSSMSSLAWDCQGTDIKEDGDGETEDLLVEIDCLTSRVLRETSLWNLHSQAEPREERCENNNESSPCTLQEA